MGWPVAKAIPSATEYAIADFIFHEIYMHYGAPQEIFTDSGKNLWEGVVQSYLKKIQTVHKSISSSNRWKSRMFERNFGRYDLKIAIWENLQSYRICI
jgi:hypothetical protein